MKCAWIENYVVVETDGWTRPCCVEPSRAARVARINDGIINAWQHNTLTELRDNLKTGFSDSTKDFCNRCAVLENRGQPSIRTTTAQITQDRELKVIQFKMSNRCQLTCAHCGPELSTGWKKLLNIKPLLSDGFELTESLLEELAGLLPQLTCLKFTGGEPFLDPAHWKILEYLKKYDRSHCKLYYITNGVSPFKSDLWDGWGNVECSVSVDGFKDSYEWFRRGATWNELLANIEKLKKFSNVSINYAITPYTVEDYHSSVNFWGSVNAYPIVTPMHCNIINFPMSLITDYQTIPYSNMSVGSSVKFYKDWAHKWDVMWNTQGRADTIFSWMNYD